MIFNERRKRVHESIFKIVKNARDDLRKLMERVDNRPVPKRTSLAKGYVEGWFSVVLDFEAGGRVCQRARIVAIPIGFDSKFISGDVPSSVFDELNRDLNGRNDRDKNDVLIVNVGIMQEAEKLIAVPSFVWLDDVEDGFDHDGSSSLYLSPRDGTFEFLPRFHKRKLDVAQACFWIDCANHVTSGMVKGGPEIVNSVPKDQRSFIRKLFENPKSERETFPVVLGPQRVEVRLEVGVEHPVKVGNVLVGPFDL